MSDNDFEKFAKIMFIFFSLLVCLSLAIAVVNLTIDTLGRF